MRVNNVIIDFVNNFYDIPILNYTGGTFLKVIFQQPDKFDDFLNDAVNEILFISLY